jgi:hypothetical protein
MRFATVTAAFATAAAFRKTIEVTSGPIRALSDLRERRQADPRVEPALRRVARMGERVRDINRVEAEALKVAPAADELVPGLVRHGEDAEPHRAEYQRERPTKPRHRAGTGSFRAETEGANGLPEDPA